MPEIKLFETNQVWDSIGPLIVSGGSVLVLGIIVIIFLNSMEKGVKRNLLSVAAIVGIIGLFFLSLISAADIWANK
ncbi:hypothetical protein M3936_14185 [Sutcliffiella horikoshii]|uniref:hypothetical protein n=1 Tax=Sutcliffiella horikoshii TaxID=79883 RepID=UPI00203BB7FC|nr:hypothetical protein [Sutcliffiella horikoshii]MCM3618736.1 hypothetical protein [Sutcliffiella horikoshii]